PDRLTGFSQPKRLFPPTALPLGSSSRAPFDSSAEECKPRASRNDCRPSAFGQGVPPRIEEKYPLPAPFWGSGQLLLSRYLQPDGADAVPLALRLLLSPLVRNR